MSLQSPYKPSPLSLGSPRSTPFRRAESPSSPRASPFRRPESPGAQYRSTSPASTPTTSPTKPHQPVLTSPSKLHNASTPEPFDGDDREPQRAPRGLTPSRRELPPSPTPTRSTPTSSTPTMSTASPTQQQHTTPSRRPLPTPNLNPPSFSQLPPALLNQLRSAFSVLDRSSAGTVSRSDVAATLADLGLPASPADVAPFFPPGAPQSLPLAQFMGSLSLPLSQFSGQEELLNAFGAFDERDCGEVDAAVLRDALVNTGGECALSEREVDMALEGFTGKKTFGKGVGVGERGDVFRYRQWVGGVLGGGQEQQAGAK